MTNALDECMGGGGGCVAMICVACLRLCNTRTSVSGSQLTAVAVAKRVAVATRRSFLNLDMQLVKNRKVTCRPCTARPGQGDWSMPSFRLFDAMVLHNNGSGRRCSHHGALMMVRCTRTLLTQCDQTLIFLQALLPAYTAMHVVL